MRGGHKWAPPRPDIKPPALVCDARYPSKWAVLRSYGTRAAKVQYGKDFRTTYGWIPFQFLKAVPQEDIDAAKARVAKEAYDAEADRLRPLKPKKPAPKTDAEDLV